MAKRLRWSGVAAGLVLAISGCGVPGGGQTAVDEDGNPVAYVVMCEGHIDSLILYFDEAADFRAHACDDWAE